MADLSGQDLIISRFTGDDDYGVMHSSPVHVRLRPMSDREVAEYRHELPTENTRHLTASPAKTAGTTS